MNFAILGRHGAGKGTHAKRIAAECGIAHLSTGDIFREEIGSRSELGSLIEPLLGCGQLVPDELTVALIAERIAAARTGFVLDGFPRTLAQAEALDILLSNVRRRLDAVLFLDLGDGIALERILRRARDEERPDDMPDVSAQRLALYHEQTVPVIDRYRRLGRLVEIDADQTIAAIHNEIKAKLDSLEP